MSKEAAFHAEDKTVFREKLLAYAQRFTHFAFLDSCDNPVYGKPAFDFLLAAGMEHSIESEAEGAFEKFRAFAGKHPGYLFGYFGYDLKNGLEKLHSSVPDSLGFPDLYFFVPQHVILCSGEIVISTLDGEPSEIYEDILQCDGIAVPEEQDPLALKVRMQEKMYFETVEKIRSHIASGDVYELNLCMEMYAENVNLHVFPVFERLCQSMRAPFSCLFRLDDKYVLSASPERFLKKTGGHIIAMPMKGTIQRGVNTSDDEVQKHILQHSEKDRAENVMIVDLVRNDLARSAKAGSVHVDELFGVRSFPFVHQMVSVVSAEAREDMDFADIIARAFPMGSMTGAPKIRAMELIDQYEMSRRGLYSGAFGYFMPANARGDRDFDLNVMIRTILYNAASGYVSVQAGSAIVYDSVPEMEYAECMLKLRGLMEVLNGGIKNVTF